MSTVSDTETKTVKRKRNTGSTSTSTSTRPKRAAKSTATMDTNGGPSPEQIAERAWCIWQEQGCPDGRDLENWLQAEQELSSRE